MSSAVEPEPGKNLLIIEDDEHVLTALTRTFARLGFTVRGALDGRQGLEAYTARPAEVVIMDLMMPEMDGIEAIRALRAISDSVRIVAISGRTDTNRAALRAAKLLGADATLEKPFSLEEIRGLVEGLQPSLRS